MMKFFNQTVAQIFTIILFVLPITYVQAFQNANNSPEGFTLKVKGEYTLTIDHVSVYEQYLEFALGQKITAAEKRMIQQEIIAQFETEPFQVMSEVRSLEDMLKMVSNITHQEKNIIRRSILETIQDFEKDGFNNAFVEITKAHNSIPLID